ncbi:MAG TPA: hypothetical protein VMT35_06850, partial [Ignavibacteriaceae bacterium]|nr:hypothetical protein [Ignavibacteriaceae bacterium]
KNAAKNFNREKFAPVLFLTESWGVNQFKILKEKKYGNKKGWNFAPTQEENSIVAVKNEEKKIIIIAGRQIVTKEKLEVLGLGILNAIGDKKPIKEVIDDVKKKGGLAVIPWGVGKWVGSKKKIVNETLELPGLFVGDNGNRPFFWSNKKIFSQFEKKNIKNLSGSDPLPFKSESGRAGSFGFAMEGVVNFDRPFESLLNKLSGEQPELLYYGKLEEPFRFFKNQILMQIKKKTR